jgi:hypothetical protein
MTKSRKVILSIAGSLTLAAAAFAQVDVSARRHPNLNAAQRQIEGAIASVDRAQAANEYDMNGHAAKAKELLSQADAEIKAAAVVANHK